MPLPLSVPLPTPLSVPLTVEVAFRAAAATLQVELVLIILHKGSADPLLPSLSAAVAVADMPLAIGSRARWPTDRGVGSGVAGREELRIPLGRWCHLSYPMRTQSSDGQGQRLRLL